jgi:ketosteroid isomerase-like protein
MHAQQVVEQYLNAVTRGAIEEAAGLLADDLVYQPDEHVRVPKAVYLQAVQAIHTAMPDVTYRISGWRLDGDRVTVNMGGEGTHTGVFAFPAPGFPVVQPTGKPIRLAASEWVFTVQDEAITQIVVDVAPGGSALDILSQMGVSQLQ